MIQLREEAWYLLLGVLLPVFFIGVAVGGAVVRWKDACGW
jgi:hypothetical protein